MEWIILAMGRIRINPNPGKVYKCYHREKSSIIVTKDLQTTEEAIKSEKIVEYSECTMVKCFDNKDNISKSSSKEIISAAEGKMRSKESKPNNTTSDLKNKATSKAMMDFSVKLPGGRGSAPRKN